MRNNHYTAELREYFESLPVNADQTLSHKQVIENGRKSLFDFEYPMFDAAYKSVFETKFIRKFYTRQIGFETFGLFKFQLETWLMINMGYFNKLFQSELITFDPINNYNLDENWTRTLTSNQNESRSSNENRTLDSETNNTSNRTGTTNNEQAGSSTDTSESSQQSNISGSSTNKATNEKDVTESGTAFDRQLESNNPDSRLSITTEDGSGVIEYASKINETSDTNTKTGNETESSSGSETTRTDSGATAKGTNTTETTNTEEINVTDNVVDAGSSSVEQKVDVSDETTSTQTTTEDYINKKFGNIGVKSSSVYLQEFRETFIRIENDIFEEMQELFMLIY